MSTPWRQHPQLKGRFHPEHPDDVQAVVHDGGPRLTDRRPELVWVRVVGQAADVFTAEVLNAPAQLATVHQGDRVQLVVPAAGHPVQVSPAWLAERAAWTIHACGGCGLDTLLDAPSALIAATFPALPPGAEPEMFTTFCGLCGGVMGFEKAAPPKKWWQFWR